MKPLQKYTPLPVAKAKKSIQLKKGTGLFDGAVTTLPEGTKMHVLAESGNWLHVMVPQKRRTRLADGHIRNRRLCESRGRGHGRHIAAAGLAGITAI